MEETSQNLKRCPTQVTRKIEFKCQSYQCCQSCPSCLFDGFRSNRWSSLSHCHEDISTFSIFSVSCNDFVDESWDFDQTTSSPFSWNLFLPNLYYSFCFGGSATFAVEVGILDPPTWLPAWSWNAKTKLLLISHFTHYFSIEKQLP